MSRGTRRVIVAALALVGLGLRLYGIQYGLPSVYNPDEVAILARALTFAKGTLNPQNFVYPTFYFYVLFGWVGAYLLFVWLTGGVASVAALQQLYFTDPTGIYTAGRVLGAVLGALCIPAVYLLGRRLFDVRVGIAAALFLAVAPLAVRDAHYIKHDIPATLAVIAASVAIARVWPSAASGRARNDVLGAGALCGVAFSTHYYCIFLALPLTWAVIMRWRPAGVRIVLRHLFSAGLASAVLFFALSPFLLVEPLRAWRDITANREIVMDRAVQAGAFAPAQRYFEMLWTDSLGRAIVALGAAGAGWMLVRAPARAVLVLAFPVSFFAFITNTYPASRYLNPILPFVAVLAGWTLWRLAATFNAPAAAFWTAVAVLAVPGIRDSVRTGRFFRTADTRALAEDFIERTVQPGATILVQPYSVMLTPTRDSLIEAFTRNLGSAAAASTKFQIQLGLDPYPAPAYRLIWLGRGGLDTDKIYVDARELQQPGGAGRLRELGVKYVILKRPLGGGEEAQVAAVLAQEGSIVATWQPYRTHLPEAERRRIEPFLHNTDARVHDGLERPGPILELWQLR